MQAARIHSTDSIDVELQLSCSTVLESSRIRD